MIEILWTFNEKAKKLGAHIHRGRVLRSRKRDRATCRRDWYEHSQASPRSHVKFLVTTTQSQIQKISKKKSFKIYKTFILKITNFKKSKEFFLPWFRGWRWERHHRHLWIAWISWWRWTFHDWSRTWSWPRIRDHRCPLRSYPTDRIVEATPASCCWY